jgi:hypothetical protein
VFMSWWEARPDVTQEQKVERSSNGSSRQTGSKPTPQHMPRKKHEPASEAPSHEDASSSTANCRDSSRQPTFSSPRFSSRRSQRQFAEQAQWAASVRVAASQEATSLHLFYRSGPHDRQQRHHRYRAATSRTTKVTNGKPARSLSTSRARGLGSGHPPRNSAPQRREAPTRVVESPASRIGGREEKLTTAPGPGINRSMSALDRAKLDGASNTKAAAALEAVQAQLREEEEREQAASGAGRKDRRSTESWRTEQRAALAVLRGSGDLSAHLRWDDRRALWTASDGTPLIEATQGMTLW